MAEGRQVWYLILIMLAVTVVSAGVIVIMLYPTAIDGQRERLLETARSQARLMEAMARHDAVFEQATPGGPEATTLSQIIDAHDNCAYACLDKPLDIEALLRLVDEITATKAAAG